MTIHDLRDRYQFLTDNAAAVIRASETLGITPAINQPDLDGYTQVIWHTHDLAHGNSVKVMSTWSPDDPEMTTIVVLDGSAWENDYSGVSRIIGALTGADDIYRRVRAAL